MERTCRQLQETAKDMRAWTMMAKDLCSIRDKAATEEDEGELRERVGGMKRAGGREGKGDGGGGGGRVGEGR